jgi:hypothetical protein
LDDLETGPGGVGDKQLGDAAAYPPPAAAAAITITLDSTFIRSREESERHLEVRLGNVETKTAGRQVFGAVTRADTDITALIRRTIETVGRNDDTEVTAFTDGCPGLRTVLANAGVTKPPILDWFHITMRLQHTKLAAASLSTDEPDRVTAKATIIAEVERLRWRIWNGKAKNAQRSINRIRKVMHVFKGENSHRTKGAPSRKLWHALHEVDKYLSGRSAWLINYAERYRAGLRVGTSVTEGTANFLVNRRMNKSQQMRWSRRGADLLLRVRCVLACSAVSAACWHTTFSPTRRVLLRTVLACCAVARRRIGLGGFTRNRGGPRRHDDRRIGMPCRERGIDICRIIGAITGERVSAGRIIPTCAG